MDEHGRPETWWARLVFPLFQQRQLNVVEWRLGLVVIGVALAFAWLIWWTFIPRFVWDVLIMGTYNVVVWVASLFVGGGTTETATPALTQVPAVGPSPSPSPFPSPSPSPSPIPR
jgi:hypothetical protein